MTAVLDTHVLIWWLQGEGPLSAAQQRVLNAADTNSPLRVSDISLWEIATLHGLGRIQLAMPLARRWRELVREGGGRRGGQLTVAGKVGGFERLGGNQR